MKKIILAIILISLSSAISAQTVKHDSTKTEFKNAIGLDATALVAQFTIGSPYTYYYYPLPEIISYRRFIKSSALKVALGGNAAKDEGLQNDTLGSRNNRYSVNIRVGYEHYSYISKRWMCYFGADVIYGYAFTEFGYTWSTTNYRNEISKTNSFGISPSVGAIFKINSRLSIATEASFDILYSEITNEKINAPINSMYDTHSASTRITTQFVGPQFINVRLKF